MVGGAVFLCGACYTKVVMDDRGTPNDTRPEADAHAADKLARNSRTRRWVLNATVAAATAAVTVLRPQRSEGQPPTTCNPSDCAPQTCNPITCPPIAGCNPACGPSG